MTHPRCAACGGTGRVTVLEPPDDQPATIERVALWQRRRGVQAIRPEPSVLSEPGAVREQL